MNIHITNAGDSSTVVIHVPLWILLPIFLAALTIAGVFIYKYFKKKNSN